MIWFLLALHVILEVIAIVWAIRLKEKEKIAFFLINLIPVVGPLYTLGIYTNNYIFQHLNDSSYNESSKEK